MNSLILISPSKGEAFNQFFLVILTTHSSTRGGGFCLCRRGFNRPFINNLKNYLTGAKGFEPLNGWTKTSCLTTWRRPNVLTFIILTLKHQNLSSTLTRKFKKCLPNRSPASLFFDNSRSRHRDFNPKLRSLSGF